MCESYLQYPQPHGFQGHWAKECAIEANKFLRSESLRFSSKEISTQLSVHCNHLILRHSCRHKVQKAYQMGQKSLKIARTWTTKGNTPRPSAPAHPAPQTSRAYAVPPSEPPRLYPFTPPDAHLEALTLKWTSRNLSHPISLK